MTALRLLLVRHGQTSYNENQRWHDHSDIALTSLGVSQAHATAAALRNERPVAIYASPLRRSIQTADLLASAHDLKAIEKAGLSEIDAGELGGLTYEEITKKFPDFFRSWETDPVHTTPPAGETMASLQSRCWSAVNEIIKSHTDATVIVVSHSFSIASIICKAIKLPLSSFRSLRIDLGSISELSIYDEIAILSRLNDTNHLNGLKAK